MQFNELCNMLSDILQLSNTTLDKHTALLGDLPEFDSLTIITILTTLEKKHQITIEDNEISGKLFMTVGTLWDFIQAKKAN